MFHHFQTLSYEEVFMPKLKWLLLIPVALIIVYASLTSFYMLDNAEVAVVERLGKLSKVVDKPGLNFKMPIVDRIHIVNTNEVISLTYGYRAVSDPTTTEAAAYRNVGDESVVLTRGSYLIDLGAVIQYKITDPAAYIYEVDDVEGTIRLAFESALRRNMQNQDLDNALINKDSIAKEILPDLMTKVNSYNIGITINELKLTDVLLPEQVRPAYEDVTIATNEKDGLRSKATKYANEMLPKARAEAYQMVQSAEAYKAEKIAQAKGDVENFNQVYEKYITAKDITTKRLYIETMEKILQNTKNKYIIDMNSDDVLKFLPLDIKNTEKGGE